MELVVGAAGVSLASPLAGPDSLKRAGILSNRAALET